MFSTSYGVISFKHHPAFAGRHGSFADEGPGAQRDFLLKTTGLGRERTAPCLGVTLIWRELEKESKSSKKIGLSFFI